MRVAKSLLETTVGIAVSDINLATLFKNKNSWWTLDRVAWRGEMHLQCRKFSLSKCRHTQSVDFWHKRGSMSVLVFVKDSPNLSLNLNLTYQSSTMSNCDSDVPSISQITTKRNYRFKSHMTAQDPNYGYDLLSLQISEFGCKINFIIKQF